MYLKNHWYVAATLAELEDGPLARTVMDEPLVFANFPDGRYGALEDACPHRRLPLSKGTMVGEGLQCGYHGLTFDADGACVRAPYDTSVPKLACAKTYRVQAKYGWLWIWMGAPELADTTPIAPLLEPYFANTDFHHLYGYHYVKGYYELLIDNLLDLSHTDIVHKDVLGFDSPKIADVRVEVDGDEMFVPREVKGEPTPAFLTYRYAPGTPVDFWTDMTWQLPANYVLNVGGTPTGRPREEGVFTINIDLMTPETHTSTHYFWTLSRAFEQDNKDFDAQMMNTVGFAFDQDVDVIEAQQTRLPSGDIRGMRLAACREDAPAMRARALVENAYKQEQSAMLAAE
ncbi:MAG: aromatic ring-hydroxylating dioxygenase subunit alpha [Pseudomonadota bacterium]